MRKKLTFLALCLCLLMMVGCGDISSESSTSKNTSGPQSIRNSTPTNNTSVTISTKNLKEIEKDYLSNAPIFNEVGPLLELRELSIVKRKTDELNKEDIVYIEAVLLSEDEIVQGINDCTITYGLYNEGWIFDSIESTALKITPLKTVEPDISETLKMYGYDNIVYSIYDHTSDLEVGTDSYFLKVQDSHKNVESEYDIKLTYIFDSIFGWSPYVFNIDYISSNNQWNITGTYSFFPIDDNTYTGVDCTIESFDGNSAIIDGEEYEFLDVSAMTLKEFVLGAIAKSEREYLANHNYSAILDDVNWGDIEFALGRRSGSFAKIYFVGKDHIYYDLDDCARDDYNKNIHYSFSYELKQLVYRN